MSLGSQIDSALCMLVADVENTFTTHPISLRLLANKSDTFASIRPVVEHCFEEPEQMSQVLYAAAVSDLLWMVKLAILADDEVEDEELDIGRRLLSDCIVRYAWLAGYSRFDTLTNSADVRDLLVQWQGDKTILGGDSEDGALEFAFSELVSLSCSVTGDLSPFDQLTHTITLIAKTIAAHGGVDDNERRLLNSYRESRNDDRQRIITFFDEYQGHIQQIEAGNGSCQFGSDGETLIDETVPDSDIYEPRDRVLESGMEELNGLVGISAVKIEISRLSNFLRIRSQREEAGLPAPLQSLHFVFTGNPGTGKTTVARIVSKLLYGFGVLSTPRVVEADRNTLVGGFIGQTAIKTSEVIETAQDGVLFIDEAYSLARKDTPNDFGQEAIETVLKRMEDMRDRLVVIVAGYPDLMKEFLTSNPGLESRFTRFIHFDDYHVSDLCEIFEGMCRANSYDLTQAARATVSILFNFAYSNKDATFGNARFVRNIYETTLGNHADRLVNSHVDIDRSMLCTIEAPDIPTDISPGLSVPVTIGSSKWRAQCPACKAVAKASLAKIGKRVTCKCGAAFICPWWNLVPGSVPELSGYREYERDEDLTGKPC